MKIILSLLLLSSSAFAMEPKRIKALKLEAKVIKAHEDKMMSAACVVASSSLTTSILPTPLGLAPIMLDVTFSAAKYYMDKYSTSYNQVEMSDTHKK